MRAATQRGLSLVELLVGSAIGLLVAAAAAGLLATQLRESRSVQVEARLTEDLQGIADLVTRDLRRAGHWAAAASGVRGLDGIPAAANPHGIAATDGAASDAVRLSFSRDGNERAAVDDAERFGYRLRRGTLETQLGAGNWQALSDPGAVTFTRFTVEARDDTVSLATFCDLPCAAGSTTCPPRQQLRSMTVRLSARSVADPSLVRSLRSEVRVRNDAVVGRCEV